MKVLGIVFFEAEYKNDKHIVWTFMLKVCYDHTRRLKLWPHQEMQQKMPAIPRSFVASRAGSYPSALRSWLCRVTLHGKYRVGELIHRKSGDICAMVARVWNRNNLLKILFIHPRWWVITGFLNHQHFWRSKPGLLLIVRSSHEHSGWTFSLLNGRSKG